MEQVLHIEPENQLTFVGPFTLVSSDMRLINTSNNTVCFKIEANFQEYDVAIKPDRGVIGPHDFKDIQVIIVFEKHGLSHNLNREIRVKSVYAPEMGEIDQDRVWKEVHNFQLMESKLKCAFVMPDDEVDDLENRVLASLAASDLENIRHSVSSFHSVNSGFEAHEDNSILEVPAFSPDHSRAPTEKKCVVCLRPRIEIAYLMNCGHITACSNCAQDIFKKSSPKCPTCKETIVEVRRAYDP